MRLLITGFDPFGGATVNPSWEAVRLLPDRIGDVEIHKLMIPTVFGMAARTVMEKVELCQPQVILCVGQAGGRNGVTPERIGINVRNGRIPDNAGNQPREQPVIEDGPDGLFATVPVVEMVRAMEATGIPASVSNSAGTFVCNDTLYTLLYRYRGTGIRVGFIHVPYLPEQGTPSLPLEDTVRALSAAISVL